MKPNPKMNKTTTSTEVKFRLRKTLLRSVFNRNPDEWLDCLSPTFKLQPNAMIEDIPRNIASTIVQNKATELYIVRSVLDSPGTKERPVSGSVRIVRSSALACSRADRPAVSSNVWGTVAPEATETQKRIGRNRDMAGWFAVRQQQVMKKCSSRSVKKSELGFGKRQNPQASLEASHRRTVFTQLNLLRLRL